MASCSSSPLSQATRGCQSLVLPHREHRRQHTADGIHQALSLRAAYLGHFSEPGSVGCAKAGALVSRVTEGEQPPPSSKANRKHVGVEAKKLPPLPPYFSLFSHISLGSGTG